MRSHRNVWKPRNIRPNVSGTAAIVAVLSLDRLCRCSTLKARVHRVLILTINTEVYVNGVRQTFE